MMGGNMAEVRAALQEETLGGGESGAKAGESGRESRVAVAADALTAALEAGLFDDVTAERADSASASSRRAAETDRSTESRTAGRVAATSAAT